MQSVLNPGHANVNRDFPNAPEDWSLQEAESIASQLGINLSKDHLKALRALQEYHFTHDGKKANIREIHDALDEKFHLKGGLKYLYELFPGGPVAQGYLIAGIQPPAGVSNNSFGSVQ